MARSPIKATPRFVRIGVLGYLIISVGCDLLLPSAMELTEGVPSSPFGEVEWVNFHSKGIKNISTLIYQLRKFKRESKKITTNKNKFTTERIATLFFISVFCTFCVFCLFVLLRLQVDITTDIKTTQLKLKFMIIS